MKKFKLNSLTSIVITMAIMLSCGGYLIADDAEQPEVVEEPVIEQVDESVSDEDEPEADEGVPSSGEEEPSIGENLIEENADEESVTDEVNGTDSDGYDAREVVIYEEETVTVDFEYDNDALAEQYIYNEMAVEAQVCYSSGYSYVSDFYTQELKLYNYLYEYVYSVADGTQSSTEVEIPTNVLSYAFTAQDLGVDKITEDNVGALVSSHLPTIRSSNIMQALMHACPYEMYWFDKTAGMQYHSWMSYNSDEVVVTFEFDFSVASEYQNGGIYSVNTNYGQLTRVAANNARTIIDQYAGLDDYSKLLAYNNAICSLVDYNHSAAVGGVAYGNPWQLVWVFDGDSNTQVVCEGYSKAFQFLCDNSSFNNSEVYAICVSGELNGGAHMWNIVHMDNGKNYLVDVTNSDPDDSLVYGTTLFLVGTTMTSTTAVFTFYDHYNYKYDDKTLASYSATVLTLSNTNYSDTVPTPVFTGHALQLSDEIGLQFFVQLPADAESDEYYVSFSDWNGHVSDTDTLHDTNKTNTLNTYMVQINLSTIQMADPITPTLHHVVNGVDQTVIGNPYSAQTYINWALSHSDQVSEHDLTIISRLADYGYYAQPYLAGLHDWTAGVEYAAMTTRVTTSYDTGAVKTATTNYQISGSIDDNCFASASYALRFGATTSLIVYLTPEDGYTISKSDVSVVLADTTEAVPFLFSQDANGRYVITIPNIAASKLSSKFNIRCVGASITVSPMSYVFSMLDSQTASEDGKNLVCALYYFAIACGTVIN